MILLNNLVQFLNCKRLHDILTSVNQMYGIVVWIFHVRTCWSAGFCSSSWRPARFQRARVCWVLAWWSLWDTEAKEKTERNNASKPGPGYSAQFDAATASAAASNRHEQEKSIRLTRLLSKGLLPWERVEGIKAFEDRGKQKEKVHRRKVNSSSRLLCSLSDHPPLTLR